MADSLQDLIDKVLQWGHDRNLTDPGNLKAQTMKLCSEFGEIGAGMAGKPGDEGIQDMAEVADGIGDCLVVAIIIGHQIGSRLDEVDIGATSISDGLDFYRSASMLGEFTDGVLKGASNEKLVPMLRSFVRRLCDFAEGDGYDVGHCLDCAYDEIKDRKGVMYNGAFIKESDERYPAVMSNLRMAHQAGAA